MGDIKLRQCKLGELCGLVAESGPDICARLARILSRVNSLQGNGVYGINDLVKTVDVWRQAAILKYFPSSRADAHARGGLGGKCHSVEKRYRVEPCCSWMRSLHEWRIAITPQMESVVSVISLDLCLPRSGAHAAFFYWRQNGPVNWPN